MSGQSAATIERNVPFHRGHAADTGSLFDWLEPGPPQIDEMLDGTGDASDKRAVAQLLAWWDDARDGAPMPSPSAVAAPALDPVRSHLFLIDAPQPAGMASVPVVSGRWLANDTPEGPETGVPGRPPSALSTADGATWREDLVWRGVRPASPMAVLPEPLWGILFGMLHATLEYREPMPRSDFIDLETGARMLYRIILVPLSEDGLRASHALGALSYKTIAT